MTNNFHAEWDEYAAAHTSPEDELLRQLTRATNLHAMHSRMLSGHVQGKLLEMMSKMIAPAAILEIGTFTGYSAICLAKGLKPGGVLHTIDKNDELRHIAEHFVRRSEFASQIRLHTGDALKIVPRMNLLFDLVFIDGDKREYPEYYRAVAEKVRKGGYIFADNVLWSGKLLADIKPGDKHSAALAAFNDTVQNDDRVENLLLPLRDGLTIIRKISG
jgi:predicted O-methyltransferase YrrM